MLKLIKSIFYYFFALYYCAGNSGYARSPTLLTPILDAPEGSPASFYTEEHSQTRCQVKRTIGILTGTWKIIIVAPENCITLHTKLAESLT